MRAQLMVKKPTNSKSRLAIVVREIDGLHCLMVQSLGGVNKAGWRLQRGGYFPIDEFEFFDEADAKVAQRKLQAYVDQQ